MEKKCPQCMMMIPEESKVCPCCKKKFDNQNNQERIILVANKKCRYCSTMIPKDAKICPHCRKTLGWTWLAKIFAGLIVFGILGSLIGKNESDTPKSKPISSPAISRPAQQPTAPRIVSIPAQTPEASKPGIVLLDSDWERGEYGSRYISGTVKNVSDRACRYAQISFNLYDASDAQVGSAWTNITDLEPNGIWKFRAFVLENRALSYRFAKISAW